MFPLHDLIVVVVSKYPTFVFYTVPQLLEIVGKLVQLVHTATDDIRDAGWRAMGNNQVHSSAIGIQVLLCLVVLFLGWNLLRPPGPALDPKKSVLGAQLAVVVPEEWVVRIQDAIPDIVG